ncbi:hypothetical protein R1sor_014048 [Riccia sorocarpa]|uniref:Uncharacterized protein n=1 Tax=Riccia sorocarpa TaxID=122646 RepID=A0ABD3HEG2_9MARC
MSSDSGIHKAEEAAVPVPVQQSCRKKKSDVDEGFVKDVMNHIDDFVHASYEEHKTCLQKTVRKLFNGMSRIGQSPPALPTPTPTPVVSVLPLRVDVD